MRSNTPYPCNGFKETALRISMSSVPGSRSAVLPTFWSSPSIARSIETLSNFDNGRSVVLGDPTQIGFVFRASRRNCKLAIERGSVEGIGQSKARPGLGPVRFEDCFVGGGEGQVVADDVPFG